MRLFKTLLLLISSSLFTVTYAQKTYEWKQASSAGYTYKYVTNDPVAARFYRLKNGLTVILSQNKKEPRIAVRIAVRTGSNNDPANRTGLAHYLEHLLFKGTDKYGTLDWSKEKPVLDSIDNLYEQYIATTDIEKRKLIYKEIDNVSGRAATFAIGGEYMRLMSAIGSQRTNAHTSVEETVYEEDIPSNAVDKLLTIESERFRHPVFRIFHTELEAVYEEKNRALDNDGRKMQDAMFATIFPTHNYGLQTTLGTIEHLKNPSIKAIRDYYYKYYVPNNMAVIMAGDLDFDQLIKKIDQQFGYMKPKPVQQYVGTKEKPIEQPITKEVYGPSAESVRILYRAFQSDTREEMLSHLVSAIFSNGKAGLIDLNINKQQTALNAGAALFQFKDYGIFFLATSPKQGQTLEQVRDLLMEQVNILKKGDFDETLIKAVAANYKLGQLQQLENNAARVGNMTDQFIKNKGEQWNKDVAIIDEMSKVTKKEMVAFVNRFLGDNNYVVLYKRKGEDKNIVKVEKPPITPVETNPGKTSAFVKAITDTPSPSVTPVWIDYTKDLQRSRAGNADILYVQNKNNDLFSLSYRFAMGKWNNKLLPIAAQYLEYLGTDKFSSAEISKQFFNLACDFYIQTDNEQTTIKISGLQENFEKAVSLFEHVLSNCKPDDAALEGLKNLILKSRANSKLNKAAISVAMQSYATYGSQNPFNYVMSEEQLIGLKASDLTDVLHTLTTYPHKIGYYGPQNISAATAQIQRLHKLPSAWTTSTGAVKFTRSQQTNNQVLFTNYDAVQSEIYWVKNLKVYDPKSEALVNLFNGYFGSGAGSLVFSTIRESKALAYSTYARVVAPDKKDDSYSIIAYVGSQSDKMNDAVSAMNDLLNVLPRTEQSFQTIKGSLLKNIETDRITNEDIITTYLNAERKGVNYDIRKENYVKYSSLKLDDVYNYHQQEIAKQPYTYCIIASDKKINTEDLKKYGELKILTLQELFGY